MDESINFDFDFGGIDRSQLLSEASQTYKGLLEELGGDDQIQKTATDASSNLLMELNQEVAELGASPEVIKLNEEIFSDLNIEIPTTFKVLHEKNEFLWLRFPLTLSPLEYLPFSKLECAMEFNPDITEGHLRPKAFMIFPDKKFKKLFEISNNITFGIGANFELQATTGKINLQAGTASVNTGAGVDGKGSGKLDFIFGPFNYSVKKAQLYHSPTGTEKVFWRLSEIEFLREGDPSFIVVLQVPRDVTQINIAAALQAYHSFNIIEGGLIKAIQYFPERLKSFFHKGLPIQDTKNYNINSSK